MLERVPFSKRSTLCVPNPLSSGDKTFMKLLSETDCMRQDIAAIVNKAEMDQIFSPGRTRKIRSDVVTGTFIEFKDRNRVAFGLSSTERAMWKALNAPKDQMGTTSAPRYGLL